MTGLDVGSGLEAHGSVVFAAMSAGAGNGTVVLAVRRPSTGELGDGAWLVPLAWFKLEAGVSSQLRLDARANGRGCLGGAFPDVAGGFLDRPFVRERGADRRHVGLGAADVLGEVSRSSPESGSAAPAA